MECLTKEQLISKGGLWFDQILDGFSKYPYDQIKGDYIQLLDRVEKLTSKKMAYVEFYFRRITKENRTLFEMYLTEEEAALLWSIKEQCELSIDDEYCYVRMDNKIAKVMLKISFYEILFCTFYFIDEQITVWSNYGGELVLFYGNTKIKEAYHHEMIAKN